MSNSKKIPKVVESKEVSFEVFAGKGKSVYLLGPFNNWAIGWADKKETLAVPKEIEAFKMKDTGGGHYEIKISLKPGKHFYKFFCPDGFHADIANPNPGKWKLNGNNIVVSKKNSNNKKPVNNVVYVL